jgi:large subunit ribosomal protein L23
MSPEQIIDRPIALTEKATRLRQDNKYVFRVARDANKIQIREAIQKLFNVTVIDVNTLVMRGKDRRMGRGRAKLHNWKKAVVTLRQGDEIQLFEASE